MSDSTHKKTKGKKKFRLKHPIRFMVIMYFLILAILIGIVYFFPWMMNQMADVMTVEYGDLNSSRKQTFYFIKYETVYLSDKNGYAGYSFREGSMVRKGVKPVELEKAETTDSTDYSLFNARVSAFIAGGSLLGDIDDDEKQNLINKLKTKKQKSENSAEKLQLDLAVMSLKNAGSSSPEASQQLMKNVRRSGITGDYQTESSGVISYKVDGYEASLSPYTMKYLDEEEVSRVVGDVTELFDGIVTKGEPVYKIVDNREWYAVTWISRRDRDNFKKGNKVVLKLYDGDMPGIIQGVFRQDSKYLVIVKFDSYYRNVATLRKEKCLVVTSNERGLLGRKSFITTKDGRKGVYLVDVTGEAEFTPIKIIAEDGAYALVEAGSFTEDDETYSTINVYDEIKKIK